ncbi:MAG TPA: cellulose biosynthesis protein BcsS, partial [Xanthobacteraceae bacterium]|nr:cellulose biosynthesis protein BcsS [Xanthobacteraceae bacterium]
MPRFLLFSGADFWPTGAFVHGGFLWSPNGIQREGFTVKLLAGSGAYRYRSGALGNVEVTGSQSLGSVMPGWRFGSGKFELTGYAGLDVQDHRLSHFDPGNRLHGTHVGLRAGADLWYEPAQSTMLAANVSASTIGPSYWSRLAAGWRFFEAVWLGPEIQALGGPTYEQLRIGVHGTSLKTGAFEWSA